MDVSSGQPSFSGSAFPFGMGGRLNATDLWMAPYSFSDNPGVSGRIGRSFGPVRITLAGRWNSQDILHTSGGSDPGDIRDTVAVRLPEFGVAAGVTYRLPF